MKISSRSFVHAAMIAVVPAMLSCAASEEPRPVVQPGTYMLTSVDGHELSVPVDSSPAVFTSVVSELLIFTEENRVFDRLVIYRNDRVNRQEGDYLQTSELHYELSGGSIRISPAEPCPVDSYCFGNDEGTYSHDLALISLTTRRFGTARRLTFLRGGATR